MWGLQKLQVKNQKLSQTSSSSATVNNFISIMPWISHETQYWLRSGKPQALIFSRKLEETSHLSRQRLEILCKHSIYHHLLHSRYGNQIFSGVTHNYPPYYNSFSGSYGLCHVTFFAQAWLFRGVTSFIFITFSQPSVFLQGERGPNFECKINSHSF